MSEPAYNRQVRKMGRIRYPLGFPGRSGSACRSLGHRTATIVFELRQAETDLRELLQDVGESQFCSKLLEGFSLHFRIGPVGQN